jgi:hypothetical protein
MIVIENQSQYKKNPIFCQGDLLAFRIVVKEDRIENPLHTVSINKDSHGSCPSLSFPKRSFYQISRTDLSPQSHLSFLKKRVFLAL